MKIGIIGSGVSGLVTAWLLQREHEVTLFEADDRLGGHAWTIEVDDPRGRQAVDLGFVVFNEVTYPNFIRLLGLLDVESQPTSMSFSVRCDRSGLEYCGTSLNTLFAQRRNLTRPRFYRLLWEISRFNRLATKQHRTEEPSVRLDDFLAAHQFSADFQRYYLLPMAAAIWSSSPYQVLEFPTRFLFRFLDHHRLLTANGHHAWRTIRGGSRTYVDAIARRVRGPILTSTPVLAVRRQSDSVVVETSDARRPFDRVVLAVHSNQALGLLAEPLPLEAEILAAIPYQHNDALLHRDARLLPRTPRARASWNFLERAHQSDRPAVTYDMVRLQQLSALSPVCVSLNQSERVADNKVLRQVAFEHPVFTPRSVGAQHRHREIDGCDRIHYCGAYWGNGFHEDGVNSALAVAASFGIAL